MVSASNIFKCFIYNPQKNIVKLIILVMMIIYPTNLINTIGLIFLTIKAAKGAATTLPIIRPTTMLKDVSPIAEKKMAD